MDNNEWIKRWVYTNQLMEAKLDKLFKGLPKGNIGKIDLATSPADTNRLYALIEAGEGQGGVYVSYDKGSTFKVMSHRKELV